MYCTVLFCIFFILAASGITRGANMPAAMKQKYTTYSMQFENQRAHNPSQAQFAQNRQNALNYIQSKLETAGLTTHLQNFQTSHTTTREDHRIAAETTVPYLWLLTDQKLDQ